MKKILLLASLLLVTSCSTTYKNMPVLNKVFPSVKGQSLSDKLWSIPEDLKGSKVLLLVGYKQDSQFDIDRWLIGVDMAKIDVKVFELPTIQGMLPRMFKTKIDEGMRKGIPKPIWGAVVTIYKDGDRIQEFTGNENPNNARVILIDANGEIKYFDDQGFSVTSLNKLGTIIKTLK